MEPPRRQRLVVMVSGNGSNLLAILDACAAGAISGDVVAVVSNRPDVFALDRAADAGVPAVHIGSHPDEAREDYDARLADVVAGFEPDLVVLAGWMRVLTIGFLGWFPEQVVNLHPALPGDLPGMGAIERAWAEATEHRRTTTGVMVHLVPDGGVDDGPVLATTVVAIDATLPFAEFETHMHEAEHRLLVDTIAAICSDPTMIDAAIRDHRSQAATPHTEEPHLEEPHLEEPHIGEPHIEKEILV